MTDKPPTPEILDAELVVPTSPEKRPRGNPNMVKGGPSTHPGGYGKEARAFNEQFRALGPKALERVTEILENEDENGKPIYDPEYVGNVARWVIERGFGKAVPMSHDGETDPANTEDPLLTLLRALAQPKKRDP